MMKKTLSRLLPALLALLLLLSTAPAALAEEPAGTGEESLIDEEALNRWLEDYLQSWGIVQSWQDFSVGFCYTATGDCWFYDADVFMYSASLYKVPVCMLVAQREAAGEIAWDSKIQGSTLEFLESSALIRSSNDCGHVLVSYMGGSYRGKCSDMSIRFTDLDESYFDRDFFEQSYYTARFMTQVMTALFEGGEERFPHVIDCLLQAQPEEYLNITLKDRWPVAQKYGAFDEQNGYNNNHIAAIVYTPTPVIVVVMTRNVGDYQNRIAEVGEHLAEYSLELDEKLAQREQAARERAELEAEQERLAAEEEARLKAEEQARLEAEERARLEAEARLSPSPDPEQTPASEPDREPDEPVRSLPLSLYLILAALALLAIPVLRHALRTARGKTRSRR